MITRDDRVITTTDDKAEAEKLEADLAAAVVEVGAHLDWGVYVKPFRVHGTRRWMYAVCVSRY